MGCFLGCFGAPKDRRRRNRRDKVQPRENHGSAVDGRAQSRVSLVQEFPQKSTVQTAELIDKPEEKSNPSGRKRVTFDTNVKTYEHVLPDDSIDFSKEKEEKIGGIENSVKQSQSQSSSENSSITSSSGSYPPNHRYQNCRESDDEVEDELDYEESDLDDDHDELLDEDNDYDDDDGGYYEDADDKISWVKEGCAEEVVADNGSKLVYGLDEQENGVKPRGSNASGRDRTGYVHPVLNPVENLTQWKAVKSKGRSRQFKPQKENLVSDQEARTSFTSEPTWISNHEANNSKNQEIAVDASLSTWLSPLETSRVSNSSSVGFGAATPEKSMSYESNSARSLEDRPILGALTVEEIKQFNASCSPRKSPSRSPDETPIIGTVGHYWNHSLAAEDSGSASSFKGIPNTSSKYREDKRVNWHSTPFETRLERALNRGVDFNESF